ncbi:MAG TPA: homoaconitase [Acidobacteriota bacterium]|nr:homoaconitase [Acidobacteriota bacterium]
MGQTVVEKIATAHAVGLEPGQKAYSGDFIRIRPAHVMTHDNSSAVMGKFKSIGATKVADPRQPVFAIDHDIQNKSEANLAKYGKIAAFASEHGIDFYPAGTGISHQVMIEEGYAAPGRLVVGSDSHSNIYGAVAALGTPIVRTDAASIWAVGTTWWQVRPVARVTLTGQPQPGVVGKDIIIALCGLFNNDEVLNAAVEFAGDGVASLPMDQRMSIANMTTEWGALAGVFPFDTVLRDFLYGRADYLAAKAKGTPRVTRELVDQWYANRLEADANAHYDVDLSLDLSTVTPHVSGPNHVKVMHALPEIEKQRVKIDKAYLLSCVNARLDDFAEAARVLTGKKVAGHVKMYVAAASTNVQREAEGLGYWRTLIDAGAIMLPAGCGPCIGLGQGTLQAGEVGISATNRNFKGRMGHRDAQVYLASPAVVAASAAAGYIAAPTQYASVKARTGITVHGKAERPTAATKIVEGFPAQVEGRVLWLPIDNLNTDGIYGGDLTYKDNLTHEEMAAGCMLNYDPEFQTIAQQGDVIVSGRNFGTGSSREQAATALDYRGIRCVIAASFSETYKRNAFNNGFVVFECPELVDYLGEKFGDATAKTVVGPDIAVDYQKSVITTDGKSFPFPPLSTVAQELVVAGGAENMVRGELG